MLAASRRPPRMLPLVDDERCTGCGRCIAACPPTVLSFVTTASRKHIALEAPTRCTSCMRCVDACPVRALARPAA